MQTDLRFDDRVVLVTGAGGGLGRAYARLFGRLGAKVVVNDLGGSAFGEGSGQTAADEVVKEIIDAGGQAIANYDSVEDGSKLVQTALDTWGRIDVVINNAGILRDTSFHKMSEDDWDLIYRVHLLGAYRVTAAAWPHMRAQEYGRIVMTSSGAGIYGNFGQANYSMAKMGLVGLASTLAIEGEKRGIHVNTIAPIAGSRLTETVLPKEITNALKPELVSPLVAFLAHEKCHENGGLFEVGGGFFAKLRWERAQGHTVRLGRPINLATIKDQWTKITSFETETMHPPSITAAMGPVMQNISAGLSLGGNEIIDVDLALGYEFPECTTSYDERDLTMYALGVGVGSGAADLQLVYERHAEGFRTFPTYGVIPAMNAMIARAIRGEQAPGLNYGPERLLHGEQYMELYYPMPPKATLTHKTKVKEIWDKGKGAIVNLEAKSYDESGNLLVKNEFISFVRGAGGYGGDRGPSLDVNSPPNRQPDHVTAEKIGDNQALLYRLSGDWNPLHVDPGFAQAFGFDRPILHGLCTFGFACRHVINRFFGGDPRYFKSIRVRFAESVFPGETLITEMWKDTDERIIFRCKARERDVVVLSHAAIEFYSEIPAIPTPSAASEVFPAQDEAKTMSSAHVFAGVAHYIRQHPDLISTIGKSFQFTLTEPESAWFVDMRSGEGDIRNGTGTADCTLTLSEENFMAMVAGEADAQQLYFGGQLQISGDMMAAQKLTFLTQIPPETIRAAMADAAEQSLNEGPNEDADRVADIFLGLHLYLEAHPDLVNQISTVFGFKITHPDSAWTLDLKNEGRGVEPGLRDDVECTLELSHKNFLDMSGGVADPQQLYFGGELKISGNIMASQKLHFMQTLDKEWIKREVEQAKASGRRIATRSISVESPDTLPSVPKIFEQVTQKLDREPTRRHEIDATVQFVVDGMNAYVIGQGTPDTILTIAHAELWDWVRGECTPRELFQRGKLRIDGDFAPVHRLKFIAED